MYIKKKKKKLKEKLIYIKRSENLYAGRKRHTGTHIYERDQKLNLKLSLNASQYNITNLVLTIPPPLRNIKIFSKQSKHARFKQNKHTLCKSKYKSNSNQEQIVKLSDKHIR